MCGQGYHTMTWGGSSSAPEGDPPNLQCDCGQMSRREFLAYATDLRAEKARADLLEGERDAAYEMAQGLIVERDRLEAENAALVAAGERLTNYLDHTDPHSNCAPMYGCFCGCLEALEAWRALATPMQRREGE